MTNPNLLDIFSSSYKLQNDVVASAMNGVELVSSWLTPTVLFCVINLMIGTIFIRSKLRENDDAPPPPLLRVPAILFQRVKSINLSRYRSSDKPDPIHYSEPAQEQEVSRYWSSDQPDRNQYSEPAQEQEVSRYRSSDQPDPIQHSEPAQEQEVSRYRPSDQPDRIEPSEPAQEQEVRQPEPEHHVTRTKSETLSKTLRAARVLKKSLSEKMVGKVAAVEEEEEPRRPATVREKTASHGGDDEEVDGKADDFINKFRAQLKLQRLDSILRYKEILNRGIGR